MLEALQRCKPDRAAELTMSILKEQQRVIGELQQQQTNHELWQAKTERTLADLQQAILKLSTESPSGAAKEGSFSSSGRRASALPWPGAP